MEKETQAQRVLKKLKRKSITTIEIIEMGILNPYGVIKKLRELGNDIRTEYKSKGKMSRFFLKK